MKKKVFICPICKKTTEFKFVLKAENMNWKKIRTKTFSYYSCVVCSFWVLFPKLSAPEKEIIYKGNYYKNLAQPIENSFIKKLFGIKLFSSYKDFVINNTDHRELLDVGCGAGDFLQEMKGKGFLVSGIDPYMDAVELSRKKIGEKNARQGTIESLKKIKKYYNLITMWHVLEHTDNPTDDLKIIFSMLNKGGKLFIEVPNSDSFNMHLFKKDYAWHMIPEHHYYFNPRSLLMAITNAGFVVDRLYTPPRALINFSYSFKNKFLKDSPISNICFVLSIPLSVVATLLCSLLKRGEVVRVVAVKK